MILRRRILRSALAMLRRLSTAPLRAADPRQIAAAWCKPA